MKIFGLIALTSFVIIGCGPVDPSEKAFYKLSDSKPFRFDKGGSVETWSQGKEYWDKSCLATGRWRMDGDIVVVEGIYNANCPWMKDRNGRFKLDGDYLVRP